jgi:hypothetical protein
MGHCRFCFAPVKDGDLNSILEQPAREIGTNESSSAQE